MTDYSSLKIEASRQALFETPVILANFKQADRLLDDLMDAILKRREDDPEGMQRSNVGGWHSDTQMLTWGGVAAQTLADKAIVMAKRLSGFVQSTHDDFQWLVQMWANVSAAGAMNHVHVHPGNLWSAVLYLDLGGDEPGAPAGEGQGGTFYFEDPRYPMACMHNTRFRFATGDGQPMPWQVELRPKRGDFIMFPAWLRHGVRPYEGTRERVSIALNVDAVRR